MKRCFKNRLYVLCALLFSWNHLFCASAQSKADPFNKTKPAATKEQIDANFQKTWGGLLATASNLPPIAEPTPERVARFPNIYADPNDYYKRYGLTYAQALELYSAAGSDQRNFRLAYKTITEKSKANNVSIEVALKAHLSGQPIVPMQRPGPAQPQVVQQGPAQPQIPQQKPVPQPVVIPVQRPVMQPQQSPVLQQGPMPQSRHIGQLSQGVSKIPPIEPPTNERFGDSYYKAYGITLEQAGQLYRRIGNDDQQFRKYYDIIKAVAARDNKTISDAFETLVAKRASSNQNPVPPIEPPTNERFGDSYYKTYGLTAEQARRLFQFSGNDQTFRKNYDFVKKSAAKNNQTISDAFETIAARVTAAKNQLPPIQPPINERFNDAYYKAYEITAEQARQLYEKTGQSFREYYELGKRIAARNKVAVFEAIARASFDLVKLRAAARAAENPLPGRPARNFWTKSAFAYIPAGGKETIESRADKLVFGTGQFIADTAAKPLEKVTLWTQPEFLDKGTYYVANPEAFKKFTLLDAVDAVFAHPLVRTVLELTIIGPLDTNKDLKMRQFIMILLVTHYNSYKLILSPMGALNFAVNRILFPIKAVSSVSKVSIFLMRQALTVFNQYNLNGGNLEQALSNQAANLVLGHIGRVASGTKRAVTGTAGLIGRGLGAVKRGFGAIFKAK